MDNKASPKEDIEAEESFPIVFAEIAPPIEILFPPGTENKVIFFFLIFFIISASKAPVSTLMIFFFKSIFKILLI